MTRKTKSSAKVVTTGPAPKLGDPELVLLSRAAKREDGVAEIPTGMKASSLQRATGNLLKRDLIEEVAAGPDQPVWREQDGRRLALMITDVGLAAIGIEPQQAGRPSRDSATANGADATGGAVNPVAASGPDRPREGSKGAHVVGLLSRVSGATLDDLIAATGWLPHTTRAALTGLRRRGYEILRGKGEDGRTTYRIELEPPKPVARVGRRRRPEVSAAAAA